MRLALPQPYEEMDHTADAGVQVQGDSAEQCLARLLLAMSQLLAGEGAVGCDEQLRIAVEPGDRVSMAIDLLRELLYLFDSRQVIAASCEVLRFDPDGGAEVLVELGAYDPDAHQEGTELKAVTLHAACFEPRGDGWGAQIVFDV